MKKKRRINQKYKKNYKLLLLSFETFRESLAYYFTASKSKKIKQKYSKLRHYPNAVLMDFFSSGRTDRFLNKSNEVKQ